MSVPEKFVGLHSHTHFSANDGLGYPQEHIDFCIENGIDGWSMTDHGNMNGFGHAWLHADKLAKAGKKFALIPGCEMYLHPDLESWRRDLTLSKEGKKPVEEEIATPIIAKVDENDEATEVDTSAALTMENEEETKSNKIFNPLNRRHHLVVIPKTQAALTRLFGLVTKSYKEGFYRFPRIDYRMLREAAQGDFFVSTACLVGDSIVNTEQGDMTIEDLVTILKSGVSISVLSYNEKTRENEMKSVTWGDVTRKSAKVIEVKLKDGKKLRLTEDHRIYTDKGWMEAGELRLHPGVKILCI